MGRINILLCFGAFPPEGDKNIVDETEKNLYNEEIRASRIHDLGEVKSKLSDKYSAEEVARDIAASI